MRVTSEQPERWGRNICNFDPEFIQEKKRRAETERRSQADPTPIAGQMRRENRPIWIAASIFPFFFFCFFFFLLLSSLLLLLLLSLLMMIMRCWNNCKVHQRDLTRSKPESNNNNSKSGENQTKGRRWKERKEGRLKCGSRTREIH